MSNHRGSGRIRPVPEGDAYMTVWVQALTGAAWVEIALEFYAVFRHRQDMKIWNKIKEKNYEE